MRAIAEEAPQGPGPARRRRQQAWCRRDANLLAAKPDGYTIATGLSTLVLLPQMQKVAFEPMQDFT
jgi:hypothetical protein